MEEELEETRAILASKEALILHQQESMEVLEGENRHLKQRERQKRKAEEESAEKERKKQRKAKEENAQRNAQRIRDLTPETALLEYSQPTIDQLQCLLKSIGPQVLKKDDPLFKGFKRNNHTHRILLSFEDLTLLLDAARAKVDEKNCHIDCRVGALADNITMWRVINGQANQEQFVPTKTGVQQDELRVRLVFIELRPDFNLYSHRFLLQKPPFDAKKLRSETINDYMNKWQELIESEKESQYHATQMPDLPFIMPPLPAGWGEICGRSKMPCVIWIKLLGGKEL